MHHVAGVSGRGAAFLFALLPHPAGGMGIPAYATNHLAKVLGAIWRGSGR